jgi:serine/threonine protein kinase
MELCEFGSLSDVMKIRQLAFNEAQVAYIMRRTLRALDYLAANNKVHRDIKPANIMLNAQGKIKLGDLGITKELKADGTLRDRIGSVLYLAPEIARDTPYNAKVDVWSLGITAIELLLGRAPRSSERTKEILKLLVTEPKGPAIQLPHASPELLKFLHRVLQVDPANRPTAAELLSDPFILKASSTSLLPVVQDMSNAVSLAGGFQAALARSSNARIELALASAELSMDSESDPEDNMSCENEVFPMRYPASVAPSPLVGSALGFDQVTLESDGEIEALLSRPILDSPVWIRSNDFVGAMNFALEPIRN